MVFSIRELGLPFLIQTAALSGSLVVALASDEAMALASRGPKKNAVTHANAVPGGPGDAAKGPQMSSTDPKDFAKAGALAGAQPDVTATVRPPKYTDADIKTGPRLADSATVLKTLFPTAKEFKEIPMLPIEYGGTSFTGLVGRLLGEGAHREHEGLKTRRFIYYANLNGAPVGIAHGSRIEARGNLIDVFVFYTPGGTIKHLKIENVPASAVKELTDGGYLAQFVGRTTDEFEVIRGKRGKVRSKGVFLKTAKYPPATKPEARAYFEKIVRAVRYNAAFMDVAYFITQHPDLADKPVHEFPDEVEVTSGTATTGPEAFIRSKKISGSPLDGQMTMQADEPASDDDEEEAEKED